MSLPPRFHDKYAVSVPTGCWEWHGANTGTGYGQVRHDGRNQLAHRVAFEHYIGAIPDALELDHLCRNRACCNPAHLEPVTHIENTRRGRHARGGHHHNGAKTHCPAGHPYDEANTYWTPSAGRQCRACRRERGAR